jgi:AcrR family transcriptional regulator
MSATTVTEIAREASVSPQTVYAAFGSKAGLLLALLDDLEERVSSERYGRAIERTAEPEEQLRLIVQFHCDLFEAGLDLIELARRSSTDPTVGRFVDEGNRRRRTACLSWAGAWHASGALRPDLDVTSAADLLWVHCGADLYAAFVLGCGWDRDRLERWLVETLRRLLLESEARP